MSFRGLDLLLRAIRGTDAAVLGPLPAAPVPVVRGPMRLEPGPRSDRPVPSSPVPARARATPAAPRPEPEDGAGDSAAAARDPAAGGAPIAGHRVETLLAELDIALPADARLKSAPPPQLSPVGRAVSALMEETEGVDNVLSSARPLAADARARAPDFASGLRDTIARSGLFYESHLAGWMLQRYPQAELAREPQAAWAGPVSPPAEGGGSPRPAAAHAPPAEAIARQVRLQLETLETGQLRWHGEAWPGQRAAIVVAEEARRRARPHEAPVQRWRTHVTLDLARLGPVSAEIVLAGDRLEIAVTAGRRETAGALAAAQDDLARALAPAFAELQLGVDHG